MNQTISPKPFIMPTSRNRKGQIQTLHEGFRTVEQFEAVQKITNRDDFDFCCCSFVFDPGNTKITYQGPFTLLWYDKEDRLHGTRIGKRGKILQDVRADGETTISKKNEMVE